MHNSGEMGGGGGGGGGVRKCPLCSLLAMPLIPMLHHTDIVHYYGLHRSVLIGFEHDLTMDSLLENGLSDVKCCYHSNIIHQ